MWGMPAGVNVPYAPLDVLRAMFASQARLHARYWRRPELLMHTWLKVCAVTRLKKCDCVAGRAVVQRARARRVGDVH